LHKCVSQQAAKEVPAMQPENRPEIRPMMKAYLVDEAGERFFGDGPYRLLCAVRQTGSLHAAALSMDMAYTKALKLLHHAEAAMGCPLTMRSIGGKSGGGSCLTPPAEQLLEQYARYRAACAEANARIFDEIFRAPAGQEQELLAAQLGCVIMASGLGQRFGGNKLLAELESRPLVEWVLDATEGIFARRVVVTRHEAVAALCRARGAEVILHELPYRSDTVRLGVQRLLAEEADLRGIAFCSGDQPLLRRETLAALAGAAARDGESIWQVEWQGQPGTPVLFPAWAFDALQALPQGKGGSVLLRQYPDRVRCVQAQQPEELLDVDRPEDLEALRAALQKG
jgi:molybdate transport repressor ModE-like protein